MDEGFNGAGEFPNSAPTIFYDYKLIDNEQPRPRGRVCEASVLLTTSNRGQEAEVARRQYYRAVRKCFLQFEKISVTPIEV